MGQGERRRGIGTCFVLNERPVFVSGHRRYVLEQKRLEIEDRMDDTANWEDIITLCGLTDAEAARLEAKHLHDIVEGLQTSMYGSMVTLLAPAVQMVRFMAKIGYRIPDHVWTERHCKEFTRRALRGRSYIRGMRAVLQNPLLARWPIVVSKATVRVGGATIWINPRRRDRASSSRGTRG